MLGVQVLFYILFFFLLGPTVSKFQQTPKPFSLVEKKVWLDILKKTPINQNIKVSNTSNQFITLTN